MQAAGRCAPADRGGRPHQRVAPGPLPGGAHGRAAPEGAGAGTGDRPASDDNAARQCARRSASPQPDRVWLLDRRTRSPQRAFVLQEVELATGRPLASITLPSDAEPVAMVNGGVLVRDLRQGLAVRDLASRRERERFGTDLIPNWFPLGQPVAGAGCCDNSAPSRPTVTVWPSTCSCSVQPSRAWPWSTSRGPRLGRCLGRTWPPRSAASRVWAGAPTAGCSSSRGGHRRMWSLPGGPADRARLTSNCEGRGYAARPLSGEQDLLPHPAPPGGPAPLRECDHGPVHRPCRA
jgi:hypothetical protein